MKNKKEIIILFAVFYLISVMFFYFAYKNYTLMNYPTAKAKIVSCSDSTIIGDSSPTKDAVLFFYADDVEYIVPTPSISAERCEKKDTITIHYNPDDPTIIITDNVTFAFFFDIVIGSILFIFLTVFLVIEFCYKKNTNKK